MAIKYTYSWREEKKPLSDDEKRMIKLMYDNNEDISYISKCFAIPDKDVLKVLNIKVKRKNKQKKYVLTEQQKREKVRKMYFGE